MLLAPVSTGARAAGFQSVEEALENGIGAYKGGYLEVAIPALTFAADKNDLLAMFYLGRIYANNFAAHTDHARAYALYKRIVNRHIDIDLDDVHRARFVAKSITALAGYILKGLPEVGLKPDPRRAAQFLHTAATTFNEPDAQYELAKLYLRGEGVPADRAVGVHWLVVLSRAGHAPAQAFFADMLWRGMYVKKDADRALALIRLAVQNAPVDERVWIEDIYQNIFCGASTGVRKQADGLVAVWSRSFGRPEQIPDRSGLGGLLPQASRACGDGELVPLPPLPAANPSGGAVPPPSVPSLDSSPLSPPTILDRRGQAESNGVTASRPAPPDAGGRRVARGLAPAPGFAQGGAIVRAPASGMMDAGATLSRDGR